MAMTYRRHLKCEARKKRKWLTYETEWLQEMLNKFGPPMWIQKLSNRFSWLWWMEKLFVRVDVRTTPTDWKRRVPRRIVLTKKNQTIAVSGPTDGLEKVIERSEKSA